MGSTPKRIGAETSKTRDVLLDCVEQLMLEEGYAAVSFRAVAARAGVTPSLVQYYFETLDGIFVAAIRRYSDRNVAHLSDALREHSAEPLRVLWKYSWGEAESALTTEFMALGNHRKSIRTEIADVTERVRKLELEALATRFGGAAPLPEFSVSLGALLLLITGLPKLLKLESGVGIKTAHHEVVATVEQYLDSVEPQSKSKKRSPSTRNKR
ncbi:TetR family transcriptional regulator [Mycobacterium colombiense]|uniref:TetR/AcrR family transcriptional regulator n=1 Tax=Mycobacterium colombiense TaxID=339268 RepID=UPI0007EF27A8|nr:TetR/AcrR family transcriptional regulator [Mycobacterium colombiense]OBK64270.1 TetR family transcriptional regulator [Mycobacterium colombiense]